MVACVRQTWRAFDVPVDKVVRDMEALRLHPYRPQRLEYGCFEVALAGRVLCGRQIEDDDDGRHHRLVMHARVQVGVTRGPEHLGSELDAEDGGAGALVHLVGAERRAFGVLILLLCFLLASGPRYMQSLWWGPRRKRARVKETLEP